MNRKMVHIDLPEMRMYYLIFIFVASFLLFFHGKGNTDSIVRSFYILIFILRGIDIVRNFHFSILIKRQLISAFVTFFAIYIILGAVVWGHFGRTFLIGCIFTIPILLTKFFVFSKSHFISDYFARPYMFCKKFYLDLIFVYLLNIMLGATELMGGSCFDYEGSVFYFLKFIVGILPLFIVVGLIYRFEKKINKTHIFWIRVISYVYMVTVPLYLLLITNSNPEFPKFIQYFLCPWLLLR